MSKTDELIRGLNKDLAEEYAAIIMYRTYASTVQGPYRQEIRNFFASEIPDEINHAQLLADKVAALGGAPTTEAGPVKSASSIKEMLQNALEAEQDTITRYVERRRQAEDAGEYGLAVEIDTLIADESGHRDELKMMLERWGER
ncbi:MAG: ferritin-like domain-containing protein [Acidobacteriota bacterium]|nr:ferritin-like domain-containing protein [Acidobacteriota bacterium]